jgi:hypothetical protein
MKMFFPVSFRAKAFSHHHWLKQNETFPFEELLIENSYDDLITTDEDITCLDVEEAHKMSKIISMK